jgi:hypothetical protein
MTDLCMSHSKWTLLKRGLVPRGQLLEHAGFLFVEQLHSDLRVRESWILAPSDFDYQSDCHIELSDSVRARVIKYAHDTGLVVVEIHSHVGHRPARFSASDQCGFKEWVPHVRWRLKGRPYVALVLTRSTFDGLVWFGTVPERIHHLKLDNGEAISPTGLSDLNVVEEVPHGY